MATVDRRLTGQQRWALALASVASFMISLDSLVVATALGPIQRSLHSSLGSLEWTINAYNLAFAALLLTGAALGDRFGRRRVFAGGLALFCLASAACALSPDATALIAARTVQGAGAAAVLPLALTQLSTAVPPHLRGKALGIFSGVTGVATFVGPLVGGAVSQGLAWQWIFWINLPIGLVTIGLVLTRLPETTGPDRRLDVVGVLLVTGGSIGVVWALIRGNETGWRSGEVALALAAGVVLLIAFTGWERRAVAPMLPLRFFGIRAFTAANVANFCLFGALYGTLFLTALYLQNGRGYGPLDAGLRLMPWTATLMVLAPVAGVLADRLGERWLMVAGLLVTAAGLGWLSLAARSDPPYARIAMPLVVAGCGISMAMPAAQKSVVGAVRPAEIGKASGAVMMLRIFGGVFGIAILTAVFAGRGGALDSQRAFAGGYGPAIAGAAIVALAGAVAGLWMPSRAGGPHRPGNASGATGEMREPRAGAKLQS